MKLFVFGPGYVGGALSRRLGAEGWTVAASARDGEAAARLAREGVTAVDPADPAAMDAALAEAGAVLVTAPPSGEGCPALPAIVPALARTGGFPDWIGYLSTTGVYGDRDGGWVSERSPLAAQSMEGARRVAAERDWLGVGQGMGLTVTVFRLPGIYGPGRSAFDRLRAGTARRTVKPGQVFSRIHVDDIASGLAASIARPRAGGVYNLCDDQPAPPQDVIAYAAELMGIEPPPEEPFDPAKLGQAAARFYAENKRVANALAKAELGWRPTYPSYREGLRSIMAVEVRPADADFMRRAIAFASVNVGRTAPNPCVGCVIVAEGGVVGEGVTGVGGRPHAEEMALDFAGERAKGGTAYVTLEPCGERSAGGASCSERLVQAGVARVVIAAFDASPFASGRGIARLRDAGIAVETSLLADEAATALRY